MNHSEPIQTGAAAPHFLIHDEGDHVGVAVQDVSPGRRHAVHIDSDRELEIEVSEDIPLGHKVALQDMEEGADVIEYRVRVGLTRKPIKRGAMVHTHNLRSARWQSSV